MKIRITTARRLTWRHRFLQIARELEAVEVRSPVPGVSGLRPRARMAGFATLRRARLGAPGMP
ncbi:MAG: hypothetical protein ABIQ84_04835 [Usitatibacter sp.]